MNRAVRRMNGAGMVFPFQIALIRSGSRKCRAIPVPARSQAKTPGKGALASRCCIAGSERCPSCARSVAGELAPRGGRIATAKAHRQLPAEEREEEPRADHDHDVRGRADEL